MPQPAHSAAKGTGAKPRRGYRLFCGTVALAAMVLCGAALMLAPRGLAPREVAPSQMQQPNTPAAIELRAEQGRCRRVRFHNEDGRFEDGGFSDCHALMQPDPIAESVRGRYGAVARAFKSH